MTKSLCIFLRDAEIWLSTNRSNGNAVLGAFIVPVLVYREFPAILCYFDYTAGVCEIHSVGFIPLSGQFVL